ncbi:hypothetical protein PN434_17325, partial [Microcystis aeruginosa CS-558/01A06]
MQLSRIFEKQVSRPMEGVIKADANDEASLHAECLTQVSETLEIAWKEKKVAGYGMLRLTEHQRTSHVNHYQSLCSTT